MMKLYDGIIESIQNMSEAVAGQTSYGKRDFSVKSTEWPLVTDRSMILRSDMAYELGAQLTFGLGGTLLTSEKDLVQGDSITLIGPDLNEIEGECDYARIAMVRVKEGTLGEGNALYNAIRKLEFVRYHFYPEGFMMRVSASQNKESVRVAKEALKKGLNFETVGSRMIQAFHENPVVEAVQMIYITDKNFPYKDLEKCFSQSEAITRTIDHILKDVKMDCHVCSLQEICDEVEGLRELHFAQKQ